MKTINFHALFTTTAIIGLWMMLCHQLSTIWQISEQYSHGFMVPILCIFLLLKINYSPINQNDSKPNFLQGKMWIFLGIPLALLLPLVWLIRGANSDWRLLNIILFTIVFLLTIIPFYDESGWKKTKNIVFPLCFF